MASSPITSWQIDEDKMQAVTDLIFLGFKITVDGDCSHEIQRCLLIGRNAMINLDSVLKSRDITLLKKVHIVKTMASHSSILAENPMDRGTWWATVHGVAQSRTQLSD